MTEALPPPVTIRNPQGASRIVLVCEHASNFIPLSLGGLGLPASELQRHIAWDIGARLVTERLSALLDAPAFLAGYSRLLIDCNRPPGVASSIPVLSEATEIPGNRDLPADAAARRAASWFHPFHDAITAHLDQRVAAGRPTRVLGIHSFTPVYLNEARAWHGGVLYAQARRFGHGLLARLAAEPGLLVGDNQPYQIHDESDYTVPVHGDRRGLEAALVEMRQDLVADSAGIERWAQRLAAILADLP